MNLTDEVKSKIEQRYKLKPTAGIDTFLIQNKDVDQFLQLLLQQQPWFENKRRAFVLIAKGVYQPIKCKKCNKE